VAVKVVVEEEEATGGKGEEGWLLILALVRLSSRPSQFEHYVARIPLFGPSLVGSLA